MQDVCESPGIAQEENGMVSMGLWQEQPPVNKSEARKTATAKEIYDMIARQNFKCALSGIKLTPDTASVDHKVPRSLGGDDSISNLHAVHSIVNRMKHTLSIDEFFDWCRLIVEHSSTGPSVG